MDAIDPRRRAPVNGDILSASVLADTAMDDIERYYPGKFDFVVVADPVVGAVRLALEAIDHKS